jgi:hypothetical protein
MFTPDQLNDFFAAAPPRPYISSITPLTTASPETTTTATAAESSIYEEFSFNSTFDLEVFNAIHQIKSSAIGMDDVPIRFLKMILPHIISIITHIFNTILMTSRYPAAWKISKITPIAKTNTSSSPADYSPISVLPMLSKAMEIIIRKQITVHIESNGMMSYLQSGFRTKHSTTTALLKVTNDILMASEKKLMSILILLDFSKAFDSVDHSLLCSKLTDQFAFSSSATSLIRSYLSDRTQCVGVNQASRFLPLASGVVQGSVLGPLLFSLFINDITAVIRICSFHLYADDVQIYTSCLPSEYVNCVERMNADLERIYQWSLHNGLLVNPVKSQALLVNPRSLQFDDTQYLHLGGNRIKFHRKVKNLGLMMNDELTWDDQVSKVCRNVLFTLKHLWTMSNFTPMETRHKLVTSLIVPQFLYCDVIFSKSTARLRERLKVAFNSCARYIYRISRYEHITQYASRILGIPLEQFYSFKM